MDRHLWTLWYGGDAVASLIDRSIYYSIYGYYGIYGGDGVASAVEFIMVSMAATQSPYRSVSNLLWYRIYWYIVFIMVSMAAT